MLDINALFPSPLTCPLLGVVGGFAGVTLAQFAAKRSLSQPLEMELDAEGVLLAGALACPQRLPYLTPLVAEDFAAAHHSSIWQAMRDAAELAAPGSMSLPEGTDDATCAVEGARLAATEGTWRRHLVAAIATLPAPQAAAAHNRLGELDAADALDDAAVISAGEAVLQAGEGRNRMAGAGLVLPAADPNSTDSKNPPLARAYTPPSRRRKSLAAIAGGLSAATLPGFVHAAGITGAAAVTLAGLALVVLLAMSIVIALVDHDTLYIDKPVWAIGTAAAWALAALAMTADHHLDHLIAGVVMVAVTVGMFEGVNAAFKLVRGKDGQGFGDTMIVIATAGIPPALTGSWQLGYYAVILSFVVALFGWAAARISGRVSRETPFALGPWLSIGWVVAVAGFALTH